MSNNKAKQDIDEKLDTIIKLLKHVLAVQLCKNGISQKVIGKHLHVAKSEVVRMLKGVKKVNLDTSVKNAQALSIQRKRKK